MALGVNLVLRGRIQVHCSFVGKDGTQAVLGTLAEEKNISNQQ